MQKVRKVLSVERRAGHPCVIKKVRMSKTSLDGVEDIRARHMWQWGCRSFTFFPSSETLCASTYTI